MRGEKYIDWPNFLTPDRTEHVDCWWTTANYQWMLFQHDDQWPKPKNLYITILTENVCCISNETAMSYGVSQEI
jgi:hypothetical protein